MFADYRIGMKSSLATRYCVAIGLIGSALLLIAAFSKMRQPVAAIASEAGSLTDLYWASVAVAECVLAFVVIANLHRRVTYACLAVLYSLFAAIGAYSAMYETSCGCFGGDVTGWKLVGIDLVIAVASFGALFFTPSEQTSVSSLRVRLPVSVGLGAMAVSVSLVVIFVLSGRASLVGLCRLQVAGISCGSPTGLATQTCNISVSNPSNHIIKIVGAVGTCGVQIPQTPACDVGPGEVEIFTLKLPSETSRQQAVGIQFFIQDADGLSMDYLSLDRVRF